MNNLSFSQMANKILAYPVQKYLQIEDCKIINTHIYVEKSQYFIQSQINKGINPKLCIKCLRHKKEFEQILEIIEKNSI